MLRSTSVLKRLEAITARCRGILALKVETLSAPRYHPSALSTDSYSGIVAWY